jgi:hypothetical protein
MATLSEVLDRFVGIVKFLVKAPGTKVQSVICAKSKFDSAKKAASWCKSHGFKSSGVDETETSYRFRQFNPTKCQEGSFRTISISEGVSGVICKPKT